MIAICYFCLFYNIDKKKQGPAGTKDSRGEGASLVTATAGSAASRSSQ